MNNFEEWVEDEIASVAWYSLPHALQRVEGIDRNSLLHLGREENIRELAHAIRNKVLHEAIEALPKEMDVDKKIELDNIKNFHYNRGIHNSKSSLLNLLTKE